MLCGLRPSYITGSGGWRIGRERGDPVGDVHRGCGVARNGEHKESRNTTLWNLRPVFLGDWAQKAQGKLYPGRKVPIAMQLVLGAMRKPGGGGSADT